MSRYDRRQRSIPCRRVTGWERKLGGQIILYRKISRFGAIKEHSSHCVVGAAHECVLGFIACNKALLH